MTHPHRDLIIALLDDPTLKVERKLPGQDGTWVASSIFQAIDNVGNAEFRINEKPKPDVVQRVRFAPFGRCMILCGPESEADLIVTFDGETGDFKRAEVI